MRIVSWLLLLHAFDRSLALHTTLLARIPTAQCHKKRQRQTEIYLAR